MSDIRPTDDHPEGGRYVDERGFFVNAEGQYTDADGKVVDKPVKAPEPKAAQAAKAKTAEQERAAQKTAEERQRLSGARQNAQGQWVDAEGKPLSRADADLAARYFTPTGEPSK